MKLTFLFFICMCFIFKIFAQTNAVSYYFDPNFNVTKPEGATYLAYAKKENNNLWNAVIVNITTRDTVVKGYYNDSLFSIPQGKFEIYSDYGVKQEEGNYDNGKKQGAWFTWDDEGHLTDSAYYEKGEGIIQRAYTYDDKGNLISTLYEDKNLNESTRIEFESGKKMREITNRLNDHSLETKIYYDNGQLRADFIDKKGKTINSKYYDESGIELTQKEYEKRNETTALKIIVPEFPGGVDEFMNYITAAIKRNNALRYETGTMKEITIIFYLDNKGKPYNIKLSNMESTEITQTIIQAMENMPRWNMNGLESYGPVFRTLKYIF